MTRRRYDTEALVKEIRRERRNAVLLASAGVAILGFLVFYFVTRVGGEGLPVVPAQATVVPAPAVPVDTAKAARPAPKAEPAPEPPKAVMLTVELGRPSPLWIDGNLVSSKKTHKAELAPGKHTVKTKVGKKHLEEVFELLPGRHYVVALDTKGKKLVAEAAPE